MRKRSRSSVLPALLAALVALSACSSGSDDDGAAPEQQRPDLEVATRTVTFEDPDRETFTGTGVPPQEGRRLETTIWYPTEGEGPFPLVMFSHGFQSTPMAYDELISTWASAGMVVAAPTFPLTAEGTLEFRGDVPNQPRDVSVVLTEVLDLAQTPGDELEGLVDADRIAAAGHSAGAATTLNLLAECCYDDRIDAAVVLAGASLDFFYPDPAEALYPEGITGQTGFADPGVPTFFVHGAEDDGIPLEEGELVYGFAPGPKAFLTLPFGTHSEPFESDTDDNAELVQQSTTDFLLWALEEDPDGLEALRAEVEESSQGELTADELP